MKRHQRSLCDLEGDRALPVRSGHRLHVPRNTIADSKGFPDLLHSLSDYRDQSLREMMLILFGDYACDYKGLFTRLEYSPDEGNLGWGGMVQYNKIQKVS